MYQETSALAYKEIIEDGTLNADQLEVIQALIQLKKGTDREISHYLGHDDPNKVRPRRFELVTMGLVKEDSKRECKRSGRTSIVWTIDPYRIENKPKCLSERQLNAIKKLLNIANRHQLMYIKRIINEKLEVL